MTAFALTAEEIEKRASEIRPQRVLLFLIGGLFWVIGWALSKAWLVLWTVISWGLAAVEAGWKDARQRPENGGP